MRQKLLLTLFLMLAIVAPFAAHADSFKINPVNLTQGETATLEFTLDNSQDYIGFQADVTLPSGLTPVKSGDNYDITLDRNAGGNFNVTSNLSGNVLKMAAFSGNHSAFTGTSGVLVNLKVTVSDTFAGGEVKVSNIIFTDTKNADVKLNPTSTELGVAVTEVTFTRTTLTLTEGENTTFIASIHPEEATDKNVTWASSDPSVATVTSEGYVVAVKAGTTNITATSANGAKATCLLTVKAKTVAVTSISLNKTELNLTEGDKESLTVTFNPENATNKSITWSSEDETVATVSATGEVTAVGEGTTTITATSNNLKEATCTVNVAKKIIEATAINLSATTAELKVNGTVTLTATVLPENATDKTVTWKSSNEAIATVDANGKVTAKAIGEAEITATCGNVNATCKVSVIPTPVESISFTRKSLTMEVGDKTENPLTPNFTPATATDKTVTWKSSDESVATVSEGVVTAVGEGTADITATTSNGKVATCKVTVHESVIEVTSISISNAELKLTEGDKATLTATVLPADATDSSVEWSSSDEEVATVSENGEVIAVGPGTATITAESSNGKKATCVVTVAAKIIEATAIELSAETAELKVNGTVTLTAKVLPENVTDNTVTWASSDEAIATVDATGKVTAKAIGEATITATCGKATATCKVTVSATEVESIRLNSTELSLTEGDNATLRATIAPTTATDKTVTWSTSDATVATVENGVVTAVKAGTATITATSANGKTATCVVTVEAKDIPVSSITISDAALELMIGKTATLTVTVDPEDATDQSVEWISSNTKVATVSADGVVTAKAVGTATITASTHNGKSATCKVTVLPIPVESLAIQDEDGTILNSTHSLALHTGDEHTLTELVTPENATDQKVTWTSSDEKVAKIVDIVEEPHQVHIDAVGVGEATITASLAGFTTSFKVTVTAPEVAITGIKLDKSTADMKTGETLQLTATIAPEDATSKEVKWSTNDATIATVSTNGLVKALKAGTVTITATANKFTDSCVITITDPDVAVTGITLDQNEATLEIGQTVKITATVAPENATDKTVEWTTSNAAVATVENGVVTAIAAGEAVITAKAGDATATCKVTVKAAEPVVEGFALSQTFNADTVLENTDDYTWGSELKDMLTATGLYMTNNSNKANNYENRDFLTFTNPVGDATHEVNISYEVYSPKDKGQANTYYTINYFNADGEFVFGIQEASGNWGYTANVITANEDGTTTTTALSKGHMSKGGGSVVNVTVKFGGTNAIVMIDGGSYLAYTAKEGIKSVKLSVTGENGYDRDMYLKNYDLKVNECAAVEFAKYTLKYVVGSEVIKEVENSGIVGLAPSITPADTADFTENGKKYIYVGNDAEGKTIAADGSTVVTITFREAAEYNWTLSNNVNDEVVEGTCLEGNSVTVPYHRYILASDSTVWMKAPCGGDKKLEYNYTFAPDSVNYVATLEYTATDMTDGIYFVEGEDIEGMTEVTGSNADVRCSNAAGGYAEEAVEVYTLKPGTYKVEIGIWGNAGATFTVKAGEETVLTAETNGSWNSATSEEFTLTAETTLTFEGATDNKPLDYVLITGTASEVPDVIEVVEIKLSQTEATLTVGSELQLTATVTPADATDATVTWSTSDDLTASVDENGLVLGLNEGVAVITAKAGDKTAECVVTVSRTTAVELIGFDPEAPVKVFDLNGAYVSDTMEGLQQGTYVVRQGNAAKKVIIR